MQVEPYLFFDGRCDEALTFYKQALGAEVLMLMRFKDSPQKPPPGAPQPDGEKVMHSSFRVGATTVMASDGECGGKPAFKGFRLSITAANDAEAKRVFTGLSEGGQVQMPLSQTFFSSSFGMTTDRFGVGWMVMVKQ